MWWAGLVGMVEEELMGMGVEDITGAGDDVEE